MSGLFLFGQISSDARKQAFTTQSFFRYKKRISNKSFNPFCNLKYEQFHYQVAVRHLAIVKIFEPQQ